MIDVAIIGAGPVGLQAAILARRAGFGTVVFEQGCIVNAIYNYPTYMTFFTTSERLEIGGHPLVTATDKPTRKEALDYYRKVVQNEALDVRQYTPVTGLTRHADCFGIRVRPAGGEEESLNARVVIAATGYFDTPKQLGIPGEDLPNVSHYYTESHSFYGRNVTIVGAGSSAADAALDLYRAGAKVTMVHRGPDFRHSLKYWVRPNLENRVKEGSITAHMNTAVERITPGAVIARGPEGELSIPTDQTFLLTGYYADPALIRSCGVNCADDTFAAELDPDTFESNVPGLYVIGSAGSGTNTSDVFIENGLLHAARAVRHIRDSERRDTLQPA
jgi:thioredoxin reductase (NADPH)